MSEVEVDEVLSFMSDKRAEVATNNAMPSRALALIELKGSLVMWFVLED